MGKTKKRPGSDGPRMIADPKWVEGNREIIKLEVAAHLHDPAEFLPDRWYEKAHWIMVTKPPNTEIRVPMCSIWLGLPDESRDLAIMGVPKKYWKILTPYGELRLHLGEATAIDINKYIEFIGNDLALKFLATNPIFTDNDIKNKLHYIRSRGIGLVEAYKMILADLEDPQLFYLVFRKEYQEVYSRTDRYVLDDVEYHPCQINIDTELEQRKSKNNFRYLFRG